MKKIINHIWFDKEAREAVEFYKDVFKDVIINDITTLHNTPSGDADIVSLSIYNQDFMFLNGGPIFKVNPSISFFVNIPTKEEISDIWEKLIVEGEAMMPLGSYPFSDWYGWVQDKYGISWQLILAKNQIDQIIIPSFLFVNDQAGKAEEAMKFYASIFKDSEVYTPAYYGPNQEPEIEGALAYGEFRLKDQKFVAMDSFKNHKFNFNEAVSLIIDCENQEEIDYYWDKLSAVPEAEQCGWLKDKYGVSWQVTPASLGDMLKDDNKERVARVTEAFLKMKKFDLKKLKAAFDGK